MATWASQALLLAIAGAVALAGLPLWSHLRRSPVDPDGVLFRSLDENLEERAQAAEAVRRRRTEYASDRRPEPGEPVPDFVGPMHGANEGVSKALVLRSLKIYIVALARLMQLDL